MNSYDIFRKLTKGMRFDKKRFGNDLKKTGLLKRTDDNEHNKTEPQKEEEIDADIDEDDADIGAPDEGRVSVTEEEEEEDKPEDTEDSDEEESEGNVVVVSGAQVDTDRPNKKKKKKKDSKQRQLAIHQQQVSRLRKQHGITVWGSDVPDPVVTFDEVMERHKLGEVLVDNLVKNGYIAPTPIQMQSWPLMLQGREILGCAPTGSGKTAAFLMPILHQLKGPERKGFRAVILAPTRELAKQTFRESLRLSEGLGLRIHIISTVNKAKEKFGPQSAKKFDILVTTPNRLVYLLAEEDNGPPLNLANVEWLVVDESDRLFEGGKMGFRDQLAVVYQACTNPAVRRAFFSATFSNEVQDFCKMNLNNMAMVSVGVRNTACSDVKQEIMFCGSESGKVMALREILRKGYEPPVLVFVQTKERAKELFKEMVYDNIMVDAIHADRTQLQRDNVVRAFRERKIWVLICTELMARGIDFKGVNLVINYDFPPSAISYIHRVGRTGRAQHQGRAITFWTLSDKEYLRSIAMVMHNSGQEVPQWMLKLKKPSKNKKKALFYNPPKRGAISQGVHLEQMNKEQMNKRKRREEATNRKKIKLEGSEGQGGEMAVANTSQQGPGETKGKTKKKKKKGNKPKGVIGVIQD